MDIIVPRFMKVAIVIAGLILSDCSPTDNKSLPAQEEMNSEIDSNPSQNESETIEKKYNDLEIITLLPKDAIRAIDNPQFLSPEEADNEYAPDELILGVEFNGDARAYSVNFLSRHEIVNDSVGSKNIAVTW